MYSLKICLRASIFVFNHKGSAIPTPQVVSFPEKNLLEFLALAKRIVVSQDPLLQKITVKLKNPNQ